MDQKKILVLAVLFFSCFQCAISTGILLNALKKSVQETRCKLHNIGTTIVLHKHIQGDPCAQQALGNGGHEGYGQNGAGFQNGYQTPEYLPQNPQNGYGNHGNYYGNFYENHFNHQHQISSGHSYGPSNEENGILSGQESTTSKASKNEISKGISATSNNNLQGGSVNKNNANEALEDIFGKPNISSRPVDNTLEETNSENYGSTSESPMHANKTMESIIEDIFGKPNIENSAEISVSNQENGEYSRVTSESYPSTLDIDVRAGINRKIKMSEESRTYASVSVGSGRNIIKAGCPEGNVLTSGGECLREV